MMEIVVHRPPLDLSLLAVYRMVRRASVRERIKHEKLLAQIDVIVGRLGEEHCLVELDRLDELRRQLRLHTRGVPLTEYLTEDDRDPIMTHMPGFSQQQHDAMMELLTKNWRSLAQKHHPDKGGDPEVWAEIDQAYKTKNLRRMTDLYLTIGMDCNLYWQQDAGLYHASTMLESYRVDLEMLQQTEVFKAVRHYMAGAVNTAAEMVRTHLQSKVGALINEINYVILKGSTHGQEGKRSEEVESQIERQGADSAGESAPGQAIG